MFITCFLECVTFFADDSTGLFFDRTHTVDYMSPEGSRVGDEASVTSGESLSGKFFSSTPFQYIQVSIVVCFIRGLQIVLEEKGKIYREHALKITLL